MYNWIKRWLPLLGLDIQLPFIRVRTEFMYRSFAMTGDVFQYVCIYVQVWRWHFNFDLYSPGRRNRVCQSCGALMDVCGDGFFRKIWSWLNKPRKL